MFIALSLLLNIASASLYFLFYSVFLQKKVDYERDWWKLILYIMVMGLYMLISQGHMLELLRIILMLFINLIFFTVIFENKKFANFAVILVSYAITMSILFIVIIIGSVISYIILPFINGQGRQLLVIFMYFFGGILLYIKIKDKNILQFLKEIEIQALAYVFGVIVLSIYLYLKFRADFSLVGLDNIVFLIIFTCIIIGSLIASIFLFKRYREKVKIQAENSSLKNENADLEKMMNQILAEVHTTKKVIPTLLQTFNDKLGAMNSEELKEAMNLYRNNLIELNNIYQGEERRKIKQSQQKRELPQTSWSVLNNYFAECNKTAIRNAVHFKIFVFEDVSILDEMKVSPMDVLKVFADHMDNSFKEIGKMKNKQGIIKAYFKQTDGKYEIIIEDNAHEFGIEILANLGTRGVSTNGTGDGFANTLETLSLYDASLIIREYAPEGECSCNKAIVIRFDGLNQFKIESYRADEIKAIAGDSKTIIEHADKLTDTPVHNYEHFNKVIDMLMAEHEKVS